MILARIEDELVKTSSKYSNPLSSIRYLVMCLKTLIISCLEVKGFVLAFTTAAMLHKSILFIGLINNDNATKYDHIKAFYSFSSAPPLDVYIAFILVVLSFSYLFKGKARFWCLVACNSLFSLLLITNLMYYRGYSSFVSPYLLSQTTNLDNLFSSIISMLRPVDFFFVVDLLFLAGLGLVYKAFYSRVQRSVYTFLILSVLSVSYIYYQHVQMDLSGNEDTMLFRVAWSPNQTMSNLSPLGYHMFDTYNYFKDLKDSQLTPEEQNEIKNWLAQNQEKLPPNDYKGMFKGQNLVMIQVESLENFVINQQINGQEITPNLNKLLANSLYFSNFYEQVYNGSSSDADLMANTSVYPIRTGSAFFRFPNNTYNSLPKILNEDGYNTLAIHPDKGSYWNWMPALTAIGFEKTMDDSRFNTEEKIGLGLSDGSYFKQIAPIISEQKQPFYDFMVTLTSHNPFDLPEQYRSLNLSEDLNNSKLGGYFQSIRYTDEQIGLFLEKLDQSGVLDNTVVVIYGDHTGVHKYYNDEVKKVEPQESWWLDDSKKIPLIIYHKGMNGKEIFTIGGQVDTMPTIAYLLGIEEDRYISTAFGRNLLNTNKSFAVLATRQYMGESENSVEYENRLKGIDISDLVIRKNYYKEAGYK
ncbi:phosphoglycerol transferase family protein, alkaline phosphatase superfamily [Desulfosporosinus meridiei DSM 13257]|uniref:Phosphoglycerol transferase family protein, alkaline phosphatase superfamily n=1 Tax=Desulfosporosinus meridiei (strain ATCC BAA-275 / DSM 13257 / KCTC 12902 / NCIMB 13706 / S10) TaxID=768704 RepID=J7IU68_DESMD|nr:phosphoglycerol transferase family protein, alkaline phosphatase superfamily [Desulfosporosinus meridiei DSM 13257]